MGTYLNPGAAGFKRAINSEIYVDKTSMLSFLNRVKGTEQGFVCVSRPRRFGKSIAANMISAYYDKTVDGKELFSQFEISKDPSFEPNRNSYDVVKINMQEFLSKANSTDGLIAELKKAVIWDLKQEYRDVDYYDQSDLSRSMNDIFRQKGREFVIVIDEWDCIMREYKDDQEAQKKYLDFLREWLKDREYISLCYMTGILPIKKYGTHSALNMFQEYSMEDPGVLAGCVGFTGNEVESLCEERGIDSEEMKVWYNGYFFESVGNIYNPKSVVTAALSNEFKDYWNRTETFEALKIYIDMNYEGLRDKVIAMMSGERIRLDTSTFVNDMTSFSNADDVLTLLIHLGYLAYDSKLENAFIPNKEIMMEFAAATRTGWNKVSEAVSRSRELLNSIWMGKAEEAAKGLEDVHLETSHLQYNDENALSYTVSLALYAAREYYTVVRELPAGKGFADLAFIPRRKYADKPAMIVELKWDKDADTAIEQIKKNHYPVGLEEYKDNMLLVGIDYDKKTRKHECIIERVN